ncbi:MAG: cell division protein FtsZ [bacterium]
MAFCIEDQEYFRPRIKVIGVGGGGGNAVNNMATLGVEGVEFWAANTDMQDLQKSKAHFKLRLGVTNEGLGAGGDPAKGKEAALESKEEIKNAVTGANLVFIAAGMGGGTGTGAAPEIAKIAKEAGALTIAVVTKPFLMEGVKRQKNAEIGLEELRKTVDSLIIIPNDRIIAMAGKLSVVHAYKIIDDVLYQAVKGISELITIPGYINIDFADVKTIMQETGLALIGTGVASGEGRAREAAQKAVSNPLLEEISLHGAKGLLINVFGGEDLGMDEVYEAVSLIKESAHPDANIIFGMTIHETAQDELRVTVVATGFSKEEKKETLTLKPRQRKPVNISDDIDEQELDIPSFLRRQID